MFLILTQVAGAYGATSEDSAIDESLRDFSIVLGAGAVGAVLGLSTLSFVNNPSKHYKNVAVGAAFGIVIGVGVVVFSQVTRSASTIGIGINDRPLGPEAFANISKTDFSEFRIAKNYLPEPTFGYEFSF
jgi:hypothetical protein